MTQKYPTMPPKTGYYTTPQVHWQKELAQAILDNKDYSDRWLLKYGAQRLYYKDQVLQVYVSNWTLHFQVAYHSKEWEDGGYGDLEGKVILSFDVESGGSRRGVKTEDIRALQKAISQALLSSECSATLGSAASFKKHEHHLIWETIDFDPQNVETMQTIACRLIEYMDAIYAVAEPVLRGMQ